MLGNMKNNLKQDESRNKNVKDFIKTDQIIKQEQKRVEINIKKINRQINGTNRYKRRKKEYKQKRRRTQNKNIDTCVTRPREGVKCPFETKVASH